jgi:hypothetical protein
MNKLYEDVLFRNNALVEKHDQLIAEFDKAVVEGKRMREMLYEQRGIIGFLESKIEKLQNGSKF